MSVNNKIGIKEKSIKILIENIKNHLNKTSTFNKLNPNDWKYLTVLSLTEIKLTEHENELKEILGDL